MLPDHDEAGEQYAREIVRQAQEVGARSVRIVRLTQLMPELPPSGDLADVVEHAHTQSESLEELRTRLQSLVQLADHEEEEHIDGMPVIVWLDEVQPERVNWLWPGKIARGKLTVLAGDPGLGKSFVTLDIAARLTSGLAWPDAPGTPIEPGGVVLLGAEDGIADTIRPRLDAAGADVSRIVAIEAVHSVNANGNKAGRAFDLTSDIRALETAIRAIDNCKLVIIDPISAYLGETDSHKNGEIRGLLAPLATLADKHGVAILAVTHLNKNTGGAAIYRTMGSLAFTAAARAAWIVTKDNDDPDRRLLLPIKNNISADTGGLAYRLEPGEGGLPIIAWEPDTVNLSADSVLGQHTSNSINGALEEAKQWLLDVLSDGPVPARDVKESAQRDGVASRTLSRAKQVLGVSSTREGYSSSGRWLWAMLHSVPPPS